MSTEQPDGALTHSVKRGVAWSTLTFGLAKGISFLAVLVLARVLAPSQFGVVAAVVVMLSLIELTSDLGMQATVIYEQEGGAGERVQTAFTLNMAVALVLTVIGVLAAPYVAGFFHASRHAALFRLASLDVLLTGLGSIHDGLLLRDLRFSTRIFTETVNAIVRAALSVTLALLGFGAASLVWGMLAGTLAWTVTQWSVTRFRPRWRFDRRIAASMLSYGIGASMLSILAQIYSQVDPTAVGRVLGRRALGLYTVAFRLPTLVLENIAYQVSLVAFPALARKRLRDSAGVGAATHRLVRYQALYALPLAAGMAVLARPIIEIIFSAKWLPASGVFAAVSVMSGISAAAFALGDAFKALGRQRVMVVLSLIQLPLTVVTIVLAAPYGITAVAWVRAASETLWVGMMIVAAARVLRVAIGGTLEALWPGIVAAAGVLLGTAPVRAWSGLPPVPLVIAATATGAAGGLLALAVLSPATFNELRAGAVGLRRRRGRGGPDARPTATVAEIPGRVGEDGY